MNIKTLQDLKSANQQFFAKGNKRFFGDIDYRLLTGKESKTKFLIQHTYQWSDMFGGPKKLFLSSNPFQQMVKFYLKLNNLILLLK